MNYNNAVRPSESMIDGFVSVLHRLVMEWKPFLIKRKKLPL